MEVADRLSRNAPIETQLLGPAITTAIAHVGDLAS